ncbi:MAG: hypothetical protein IH607_05590, partial [Firmicutes bacterium]|nr:hypothetical protein [Bacillota bacterium]
GLLYTNGGQPRDVETLYGETVTLYGDGIYADNSLLKTGATKGTDVVAAAAALLLLALVILPDRSRAANLLRAGLLAFLLYAATCLVMGVQFNRLFLVYVAQFGAALFALILTLRQTLRNDTFTEALYQKRQTGTGVFLLISGCSVMVWLSMILPAVMTGEPMEIIERYTTEPTFVVDLGVILPAAVFAGVMVFRRKAIGFQLGSVMMTLLTGVGLCVVFQTVFQSSLGIALAPGQIIGLVGSFVCLGAFAVVLNARLLRYAAKA